MSLGLCAEGKLAELTITLHSLITYTTVWSLLDLPCYTFPVGVVDERKDPKPVAGAYTPVSDVDKENWEGCESILLFASAQSGS